ncbi:MAG: transketolase [Bacillota bacterium]|nr:transketolase [Bacillota bacterium]
MLTEEKKKELKRFAAQIRLETLHEFKHLGFGHVGGSMSIVETLAVLYGEVMNVRAEDPEWKERDWLVLSKGHAGPSLYATLALKGFFSMDELKTLNRPGTALPSHCDRNKTIGVDMTTGSLGQGISTAIGIALGNRLDKRNSYTYLILGDGECNEGQVWEGALFAAHHRLDNMIAFVDYNKQQLDGYTRDILDLGNLAEKFACFGWYTYEVDGHDIEEIYNALMQARSSEGKPSAIILHTQKGKGCTFAEGILDNHHMAFTVEQIDEAISHIEIQLGTLMADNGN